MPNFGWRGIVDSDVHLSKSFVSFSFLLILMLVSVLAEMGKSI